MTILSKIQAALSVPKNQHNDFGGYNYRSCEDILEAVKPHLAEHGAVLTLSDTVEAIGDRIYFKATAHLTAADSDVAVSAYAREAESKKGMDSAQLSGATSSYARKIALNGLFCLDDNKDADTQDNRAESNQSEPAPLSSGNGNGKPQVQGPQRRSNGMASDKQVNMLRARARELGVAEEALCSYLKVPELAQLPMGRVDDAVAALNKKKAAQEVAHG